MKKFDIKSVTVENYKDETINNQGAIKIVDTDTDKEYPIHLLERNRKVKVFNSEKDPLNERAEFCQSIQDYGVLTPIMLFLINDIFYITDGQHRFLAAKHYRIPLRFEIFSLPDSTPEEAKQECVKLMQECNSMAKNWGLSQYENSKMDRPALKKLEGLRKNYRNIEKNVLVMIADNKEKFNTSLYLNAFKFEDYNGNSVDEDRIKQIDNLIGNFIKKRPTGFNIPADLKRTVSLILSKSATPEKLDSIAPKDFGKYTDKFELQKLLLSQEEVTQIQADRKLKEDQAILKYLIPKIEVEISNTRKDFKLPKKEVREAIKSFIAKNDFEKGKLEEALVSADPSKFTKEITASTISDIYNH